MTRTYAVKWRGHSGRAELSERGLDLTSRDGLERIPFAGMGTLRLTRDGLQIDELTLRSLDGPGALRELADLVAGRLHAIRRP